MASPGEHVRAGLSAPRRALTDLAAWPVGLVLGAVAAARGGKAVHPHGAVHAATLIVPGGPPAPAAARLLSEPGEHRAIVRFSRSVGLPRPLPDLLGVSLRVPHAYGPGRHQDILCVSSIDLPLAHHVFVPAGDVQQRPYSSSLPYHAGGERFLVGVLPDRESVRPEGGDELERTARAAAEGLRFRLAVAPLMGRFRPVAELHIGDRLPGELDALRFHPWNTGGGMEPTGLLNRMRDYAYPLSQAAWRRTRRRGAVLQEAADAVLADERALIAATPARVPETEPQPTNDRGDRPSHATTY